MQRTILSKLRPTSINMLSVNNRSITTNVLLPFFHSSSLSLIMEDNIASISNIMQELRMMTSNKFISFRRNILDNSSSSMNNNLNDNVSEYSNNIEINNISNNLEECDEVEEDLLSSGLWFGSTMKKRSVMMNKHKKKKRRKERRFNTKSSRASK